jgi:hypothetical protein
VQKPLNGGKKKRKVPLGHIKCQVKGCPSFAPIVDLCDCAEEDCEKKAHLACYNRVAGRCKVVVSEEHVFCTMACQKKYYKKQAPLRLG